MIVWTIIIGALVWEAIALTRHGSPTSDAGRKSLLYITKERDADGEILKEEFDRIKRDLT